MHFIVAQVQMEPATLPVSVPARVEPPLEIAPLGNSILI